MKVVRTIDRLRWKEKDGHWREEAGDVHLSFYDRNGERHRTTLRRVIEMAFGDSGSKEPAQPAHSVGRVTFEEAADSYLKECTHGIMNKYGHQKSPGQVDKDEFVLGRLKTRFAGRKLTSITHHDLEDYILDRSMEIIPRRGTTPTIATLNRDKAVLKGFYTYCNERGLCNVNPASTLKLGKENNMRLGWTPTDMDLLMWSRQLTHNQLAQDIFMTLVNTGLRLSEVLKLKTEDYQHVENGARLFIRSPKGQESTWTWVNDSLEEILDRRRELGDEWLFAQANGKPYSVSGIEGTLFRARDRAGLRRFRVHDIRRFAATTLSERCQSVPRAKELLHHKTIETTMRYIGVRDGQGQEAVQALNDMAVNKGYRQVAL